MTSMFLCLINIFHFKGEEKEERLQEVIRIK